MDTFINFAISQVITAPSPPTTGTVMTLSPGAGAYMPPIPCTVAIFSGTTYATPANAELARVTAIAGDTLTLTRAIEGTTARTIIAGDYVAQTLTAQFVADVTNSTNQSAGTLPDARLSSNVALKNAANTFTQIQRLSLGIPRFQLNDLNQGPNLRMFELLNTGGLLVIQAIDDALTTAGGYATLNRAGVFTVPAGFGSTPINASQATSGTLPDARLSANVALKNLDNHWVAQTFAPASCITGPSAPYLVFNDTAGVVNTRAWRMMQYGDGILRFEAVDDAQSAPQSAFYYDRAGSLTIAGAFSEKNRTTPIGHWIDVPYSPTNFGATGGTWTVTAPNVARFSYALVGKTAYLQVYLDGTTVGGAPTSLNLVLPLTLLIAQSGPVYVSNPPNVGWCLYAQGSQDIYFRIYRDLLSTPFVAGSNTQIRVSVAVQIL